MSRSVKTRMSLAATLAGALIGAASAADSFAAADISADAPLATIDLTTDSGVKGISGVALQRCEDCRDVISLSRRGRATHRCAVADK